MPRFISPEEMTQGNCASALAIVRRMGRVTRRQLQEVTSLSWGGVTNTVNRLTAAGYIAEHKEKSAAQGRTPGVIEINGENNFVLGADVNETGLSACVMNLKNEILAEYAADADLSSPEALIDGLGAFIARALGDFADKNVIALGVSMQGEVDDERGISLRLPQCPGWRDVPLADILKNRFAMDVSLAHDPDCMLMTHIEDGGENNTLLLRLDKSVGMAVAIKGRMVTGSGLWEVAHSVAVPGGRRCACGKRGCLDAYVAACGIKRGLDEAALNHLAQPLAMTVHNLICLFHPDRVILCGELLRYADIYMEDFRRALADLGGDDGARICVHADARTAMRGAALLAARQKIRHIDISGAEEKP